MYRLALLFIPVQPANMDSSVCLSVQLRSPRFLRRVLLLIFSLVTTGPEPFQSFSENIMLLLMQPLHQPYGLVLML